MKPPIIIDFSICNGKPTFQGTRITVQTVLEMLAAGDSTEDVLNAYPALKRRHVLAALTMSAGIFAAELPGIDGLVGNEEDFQKTYVSLEFSEGQKAADDIIRGIRAYREKLSKEKSKK